MSNLKNVNYALLRVCSLGMIQIRINDPRALGSWCIKGTEKSTLGKDSSVALIHHDRSDLGSVMLIRIIPKQPYHLSSFQFTKCLLLFQCLLLASLKVPQNGLTVNIRLEWTLIGPFM